MVGRFLPFMLLAIACTWLNVAGAADADTPPDWARGLRAEQLLWLGQGGQRFAGVLRESTVERRAGAVIVLHDARLHPNHTTVAAPLASSLPRYGWATFAVQMPDPGPPPYAAEALDAALASAAERIASAVSMLKEKGYGTIALVGHGFGATMGAHYLAQNTDGAIAGFVGLSMGGPLDRGANGDSRVAGLIGKITLPVLDLYGSRDLKGMRKEAAQRAAAAARVEAPFRQVEMAGADHTYTGLHASLAKHVAGWLRRYVEKNAGTSPETRKAPPASTGDASASQP